MSFYVVGPTHQPVDRPYVLAFSLDVAGSKVYELRGTADGRVDIPIPVDDPAIVERVASQMPVNLLVMVLDKRPPATNINATFVGAMLNVGGVIPDAPLDIAGVSGQIFELYPDRVDFVKVGIPHDGSSGGGDPGGGDETLPRDDPDCPYYYSAYGRDAPCDFIDYPPWSRHTKISFAENYGGGQEMAASLQYETNKVTTSSIAVTAGRSGFFEYNVAVGYQTDISSAIGFPSIGNGNNKKVFLDTEMQRNKKGLCVWGDDGERHCTVTTTYKPGHAHGGFTDPHPHAHDRFDGGFRDCWTRVPLYFDSGKGQVKDLSYSLTFGPGEAWSASLPAESHYLHATTKITGQVKEGTQHVRRWDVTAFGYEHHLLYVAGGRDPEQMVQTQPGHGPGNCPETAPGLAWTHAQDRDPTSVLPDPIPEPTASPTPVPSPSRTYYECDRNRVAAGGYGGGADDPVNVGGGAGTREGTVMADLWVECI